MGKKIGRWVNNILGVFGVAIHTILLGDKVADVKGHDNIQEANVHLANLDKEHVWLKNMGINSILDIGANEGQFAERFLRIFPESEFYCFEPLADIFEKLRMKFGQEKRFHFFQLALGLKNEKTKINRNEYSPSSSLLPMKATHKEAFDFARKETIEQIEIRKLDEVMLEIKIKKPYLVKIDVQGYELPVIEGGKNIISGSKIVILETSFVELYENSPLFDDIYKKLFGMGFTYVGSLDQLKHPQDGKILQQDAIFIKNENYAS